MRLTCTETRVAPASSAARIAASTAGTTVASSPSPVLPNGPNSTVRPCAAAASTAASTCGPGEPGTKGSTVNSTRRLTTRHPNRVLLANGVVVDVDGERRADLRVGRDGRIAEIGDTLAPLDGEHIVDCATCLVVPG